MMLLSELAREHGVFDWISSVAVRRANGSCSKLFILLYAVGIVVAIFMSNDATAVVLTPAILAAVCKAKVEPLPYIFVCAFVANAASFLLPISNPANLVVFRDQMPPLQKWLCPSESRACFPSFPHFSYCVGSFASSFAIPSKATFQLPLKLNGKLVLVGLAAVVLILLAASALGKDLGLPTCLAALAITAAASFKARCSPLPLAREISWETLALVAGLFVLVDAVESIGAMRYTQKWLAWASNLGPWIGTIVTGFVVGIANNLVNNRFL